MKIGTTAYSFGKWSATLKSGLPKVTNWNSGGAQQLVAGIIEADLSISGPYDEGNMAFSAGTLYTFVLGFDNSVSLTVPAYVESIKADDDVEDAPRIQISAKSSGTFSATIT